MKILVCYNPYSSTQKISHCKDIVKKELKKKYDIVDFFESTAPRSITKKIATDGNLYDTILASGGDGTLNEAVTGIIEGDIKANLAYIPSGTVNDMGSILGLSKNVKKGCKIALKGVPVKIDIGKINNRYFTYVCAAGKFSAISYDIDYKLKKTWGKFAYAIRGIQEFPRNGGMRVRIITDEMTTYSNCYIMFGLNYRQFGGFRFYRKKEPLLNDGLMDFTFVEKYKKVSWLRAVRFILHGDRAKQGVRTITTNKLRLECDREVAFNVDGEQAFIDKSIDFEVLKERVSIIVPKKTYDKYFNNNKK